MENVFINKAFDSAIKDYLIIKNSKNEVVGNSFSVMVLKMLASIYGEIDIINPYIVKNEKSFRNNITKFGYSDEEYDKFIHNFSEFYKINIVNEELVKKQENPYFVSVQKNIIDMYCKKKFNYKVTISEESEFFDLLYTSKTEHPLRSSYNYITASDVNEVEQYFIEQIENDPRKEEPRKSEILNLEAYELLNYSLTDIANMDADDVDRINESIYNFFEIDESDENKKDLLNYAVENYKRYNTRLTSGNGYVDILLVMGVVVTGILVLTIASIIIF